MTTVLPPGQNLRHAIRWISEQRRERPDVPLARIVDEAALKFDLTPVEQETLVRTFVDPGTSV